MVLACNGEFILWTLTKTIILGVHPSADLAVIKAAYKALAMLYHPDRTVDRNDNSSSRMAEINEAYSVLKNKSTRKEYDASRGTQTHSANDFVDNGFDETAPQSDPLEISI